MIYLDNSATTKVDAQAMEIITHMNLNLYANPSSLHSFGVSAQAELNSARKKVAKALNARPNEIIFTSGGTEANNLAIIGAAKALKRRGSHIVTSTVEHESVLNAIKHLESTGFSVTYIEPDENHNITPQMIKDAVREDTVLISLMYVNNETGYIMPIRLAKKILREKNDFGLVHSDCVQAFSKTIFTPDTINADLISISGHKTYAPKGIGALYIRNKTNILPIIFGGGQESGIRSGTENISGACAFGYVCEKYASDQAIIKNAHLIRELNTYFREKALEYDFIKINSTEEDSEYIISFYIDKINAETLVHFLYDKGIVVSSGAACSSKKSENAILKEFKFSKEAALSSVRVSFGIENTKEDMDKLIKELVNANNTLAKRI